MNAERVVTIFVCAILGMLISGVIYVAFTQPDHELTFTEGVDAQVYGWKVNVMCVETDRVNTDKVEVRLLIWKDFYSGED